MRTVDRRTCRQAIPAWGVKTLRALADTHHVVANIECELHYATHLRGIEPRLRLRLSVLSPRLSGTRSVSVASVSCLARCGEFNFRCRASLVS